MPAERPISTYIPPEKCILVGVDTGLEERSVESSLDELARLANTAGADPIARLTQRLDHPNSKTFLGSGKVLELKELADSLKADVIIFDVELTPSQQANLEIAVGRSYKIIDRTALILDIFGLHATTHEGKIQVQMAQLQYLYPRLRGMWAHLAKDKTRGGIGSRFGQGESQLEVDRRLIRKRISVLRDELAHLETTRSTQQKSRYESDTFRVSLAGYTNAGKSTLLNQLTGADVYVQDQLFATLDPTSRVLELPGGRQIIVSDTVGFVQKLPTTLVEAFKSTLSEVAHAHLILKVVDATDENREHELKAVDETLDAIHAHDIPVIVVYNKCDLLDEIELEALQHRYPHALFVSAQTGWGIDTLIDRLSRTAAARDTTVSVIIPFSNARLVQDCHTRGRIIQEECKEDGYHITAEVPPALAGQLMPYSIDKDTDTAQEPA
ncbi:MAG: GTPase HflX [Coriobacteriales bacterium]|nr:GTPase HflX [Coriobacteriales bacterium]